MSAARSRASRWDAVLNGTRSTGLFVFGVLFDITCVMNVPGGADFIRDGEPTAHVTARGGLVAFLAIVCWVTVFFRARFPLATAVAGGVLLLVGTSYALALVASFHVLMRWPRRATLTWAVTIGAVAIYVLREVFAGWGTALVWLLSRETARDDPAWAISSVMTAALSLGLLAVVVAYRRARVEASLSSQRATQLHQRADALDEQVARQAERERIARDLHDGLGHRLSSMALAAGAFESQAAAAPVDPALTQWAQLVRRQAHAALEEVRDVVGGLRDEATEARPSARVSLRQTGQLLADLRATGHATHAYVVVESIERLDPLHDSAAFRVVQELLTNVMKHAPGAPVAVFVDAAPERGIRIRISNPLMPGSFSTPSGQHGIEGIRGRAAAIGGTAWIGPHEGQFLADVSLPWE